MKPERERKGVWDWVGSQIHVEVKPLRYFPRPPGPIRSWFLRGGRRRQMYYREMALVAVATFGGLFGLLYAVQATTGRLLGGGAPIPAYKGLVAIALCIVAIAFSPRRRMTIACVPALLLALSFWAAVLHPSEPAFWQICAGCILALALIVRVWGWRLDQ